MLSGIGIALAALSYTVYLYLHIAAQLLVSRRAGHVGLGRGGGVA